MWCHVTQRARFPHQVRWTKPRLHSARRTQTSIQITGVAEQTSHKCRLCSSRPSPLPRAGPVSSVRHGTPPCNYYKGSTIPFPPSARVMRAGHLQRITETSPIQSQLAASYLRRKRRKLPRRTAFDTPSRQGVSPFTPAATVQTRAAVTTEPSLDGPRYGEQARQQVTPPTLA